MASNIAGVLNNELAQKVNESKLLVVGAGGIGCELIKNLVLTGFSDIDLIDLDTIDVSNLNRQFLFRKEHVGKSKAEVARESALQFNPDAKIKAFHDSIMSPEYGVEFFRKYSVVMNALDNRAARNHVNRMCLAADRPLIESGTAGYLGQVTVIKKGETECYECQPKPAQKTFPGCTIRNTPSEPIHCIVWAKHLFNQLFGEEDPDQDVSPDTEDPELAGEAGEAALNAEAKSDTIGGIERRSTRAWAQESDYDVEKLFNKLFRDDIKYLLSMETLWRKRRPPVPMDWSCLPSTSAGNNVEGGIRDQRIWNMHECAEHLQSSVDQLKVALKNQGEGGMLVWDKDDEAAMDFVTSAANIRAQIFAISQKSRFDIKSMAGNIIPAIATTNAIIAGLLVLEGLKVLEGMIRVQKSEATSILDKCRTVFLNKHPNPRNRLLVPCVLDKPSPKCYVCSEKPEVTVRMNTNTVTMKTLEDHILKGALGMVAPDVEIDDGKGTIIISSEEGETEENAPKALSIFGIGSGSRLKCDDFLQVYNLNINILHVDKLDEDKEFEVIGDISELQSQAVSATAEAKEAETTNDKEQENEEEEEELMIVDEAEVLEQESAAAAKSVVAAKRKADDEGEGMPHKKARLNNGSEEEADIVIL